MAPQVLLLCFLLPWDYLSLTIDKGIEKDLIGQYLVTSEEDVRCLTPYLTGKQSAHLLLGEREGQPLDQDCQQNDSEAIRVWHTDVGQP